MSNSKVLEAREDQNSECGGSVLISKIFTKITGGKCRETEANVKDIGRVYEAKKTKKTLKPINLENFGCKTSRQSGDREDGIKESNRLLASCKCLSKHMGYFAEDIENVDPRCYKIEGKSMPDLLSTFLILHQIRNKIKQELEKTNDTSEQALIAKRRAYRKLTNELFDALSKIDFASIEISGLDSELYMKTLASLYDDLYIWVGN